MTFETFAEANHFVMIGAFVIALILGMTANKTNFCTMGAVSDMLNIGCYDRFRAWMLAIAVATLGVAVLEYTSLLDLTTTFPPYRSGSIILGESIIGGLLFGIGMTLASGCGNKTLVRLGGGNMKSLVVIAIIGVVAYYMVNPFPDSDQTLYSVLFYHWIRYLVIPVSSSDVGALISSDNTAVVRLIVALLLGVGLLFYVFKSAKFRKSKKDIIAGIIVGACVLGGWYLTQNTTVIADDEPYTLSGYYNEWEMLADDDAGKPAIGRNLSTQSLTFINPMGQVYGFFKGGFNSNLYTFGLFLAFGIIAGSFLMALFSRSLRLEWFANFKDFRNHFIGAILMGIGGTLALGCTFGQGITGVSTMAVSSFVSLVSIILGSALTMKNEYYRMVYEDEATFFSALSSSMVDFHLLPGFMRKHEHLD